MSKSWQIYRSRLIGKITIYLLLFGLGVMIAQWNTVNCEIDRIETYVKI